MGWSPEMGFVDLAHSILDLVTRLCGNNDEKSYFLLRNKKGEVLKHGAD